MVEQKKTPSNRRTLAAGGVKRWQGLRSPAVGHRNYNTTKGRVVESKKIGGDTGDDQGVQFYHGNSTVDRNGTTDDGIYRGRSIGSE
jgi:hypothetical protein